MADDLTLRRTGQGVLIIEMEPKLKTFRQAARQGKELSLGLRAV